MERTIDAFKIVETSSPMPSVEVDIDSTSDGNHRDIIEKSLVSYAAGNKNITATIYDYFSSSVNFGHHTNSVFYIVAKSQPLLKHIHASLKFEHSLKVRFGEYIPPSKGGLVYHIEDGQAWRLDDAVTFTLLEEPETDDWIDEVIEPTDESGLDDTPTQANKRLAARTYRARSDASIGSIKSAIEEVFGLPEGSVALCAPDGKHMRSDAKIRTLRNRWDG